MPLDNDTNPLAVDCNINDSISCQQPGWWSDRLPALTVATGNQPRISGNGGDNPLRVTGAFVSPLVRTVENLT
jgi:hypothetical protein